MLLAGGGSGVATLGLPASAGVPASAVADTVVVPYNVVPDIDERVACVIVEPVAANMGLVAPAPGFLAGLRAACDAAGALLVFDEVITGFRVGPGGMSTISGVTPDLWCFGKVIGGGLPVGAFGGRSDVLAALAPDGPVYQAGTLSGNPLATAAGLAVLETVDRRRLRHPVPAGRDVWARDCRPPSPVRGFPSRSRWWDLSSASSSAPGPCSDYESARASVSSGLYAPFFSAMLERGVALAPGPYEAMFPGLAHLDADLDAVVEVAAQAAAQVAGTALVVGLIVPGKDPWSWWFGPPPCPGAGPRLRLPCEPWTGRMRHRRSPAPRAGRFSRAT